MYSYGYGSMFNDLRGEDIVYARSELKDRITEAILNDDRFEAVTFTEDKIEKKKIIFRRTI